jgi:hypothetical protein
MMDKPAGRQTLSAAGKIAKPGVKRAFSRRIGVP